MTNSVDRHLLGIYLNDHVTGATAALARVRRMARVYRSMPIGSTFRDIAAKIEQERSWLVELMEDLDLPVRRYKIVGARLAERLGRLTLNGRLVRRSRLTPLLETEILRSAVAGKYSGWSTLKVVGASAGLTASQLQRLGQLQEEASEQLSRIDATLEWLRPRVFADG